MWVPIRQLLDRERRAELRDLRAHMRDRAGSLEERALAAELRRQRAEVAAEIGPIAACGSCAKGAAAPEGAFEGGLCCSANTASLFSADEASALAIAGTRMRAMATPSCEQAGCAFRGPTGCTLSAVDRPNVCVMYLCTAARRELFDRGQLDRAEELVARLEDTFHAFARARAERRDRAERAAIHPELA